MTIAAHAGRLLTRAEVQSLVVAGVWKSSGLQSRDMCCAVLHKGIGGTEQQDAIAT